jgi:hypothetical protein
MLRPDAISIVLLPQEKELIAALGISEAEYRWFVHETYKKCRIQPAGPQNFLIIPFLIQLAIGAILSIGIGLLFGRQGQSRQFASSNNEIRQTAQQGESVTDAGEFAPKAGFDAVQQVVELGSTIPLIYARRRGASGGVRVNTPLLWSQLWSLSGSQMLRALFSLGEGPMAELDPDGFAIGDNTINNFSFLNSTAAPTSAKVTVYFNPEGGRIKGSSFVGRTAANDPGNAMNAGGSDVFQVRALDSSYQPWFCNVSVPSTTREFGVYTLIPNDLGLRTNSQFSPNISFELRTTTDSPGSLAEAQNRVGSAIPDPGGTARLWKNATMFTGRSGIVRTSTGSTVLNPGDTFTYVLDASSDLKSLFLSKPLSGTDAEGRATCGDVASVIASRQNIADNALSVGNVFKAGTCIAVLEARSPDDEIFRSTGSFTAGTQSMTYTFRVIRGGVVTLISQEALAPPAKTVTIPADISNCSFVPSAARYGLCSTRAQIFQLAIGGFTIDRPSRVIEIGFRSRLGIGVSGLCNFRTTPTQTKINEDAGLKYNGQGFKSYDRVNIINFNSGNINTVITRYSFFRVSYRNETDKDWFEFPEVFGMRGLTRENVFNYLRFIMPTITRWEFRLEPITSYEIRNIVTAPTLNILDNRLSGIETVTYNGVTASWTGTKVPRSTATFRLSEIEPTTDLGITYVDGKSYFDEWGAVAEAFIYQELTTTASGSPEHSIAYVNTIIENDPIPNYENLSTVGINLFASTEFTQLEQFSSYVRGGIKIKRFIEKDIGPSSNFADILYDLLTNNRYGVGKFLSPSLVDTDSFAAAAAWCDKRGYTWDGALTKQLNLRSWASSTASYFLLDFLVANGQFALAPTAPFDEPVKITGLFTAGNIFEDSFTFSYANQNDRQPIQVSVKWREERLSQQQGSKGLFPILREVLIRETGTAATAPLETVDLSDFCTTREHAIDVGKFLVRNKRLSTGRCSFTTTPSEASLRPGSVFKLGIETIAYDQPNNGFVLANGQVNSSIPLEDGSYTVAYWDGKTDDIKEGTLKVEDGQTGDCLNSVFCIQDSTISAPTYKVQSLSFDEDGNVQVEAILFPTDSSDYSLITKDWNVGWEIID